MTEYLRPGYRSDGTSSDGIRRPAIRTPVIRWVALAIVEAVLLLTTPASLTVPAPWHPAALATAIAARGPFLGTVAVAHLVLVLLGAYLLALGPGCLLLLALVHRSGATRRSLPDVVVTLALPGTRSLVAWMLGLATLSVVLVPGFATAAPSGGSTSPEPGPTGVPALTWLGPPWPGPSMWLTAPSPRSPARGSTPDTAPPSTGPPRSRTTAPTTTAPAATPPIATAPAAPAPAGPSATPPAATDAPTTATPTIPAPPGLPVAPASGASPGPTAVVPSTHTPATDPPATDPPATAAPGGGNVAPTATTPGIWTVRPGDHLWSIASRTVRVAGPDAAPDDAAIAAYWWQVVSLNRSRLPDPANIDLLYPGDVVILPALPAPT